MTIYADSPDPRPRIRGPWLLLMMVGVVIATITVSTAIVSLALPGGLETILGRTRKAPVYTYEVVNTYPHDTDAFTQGLVIDKGELFESTGLFNGRSSLRRVDLKTGKVLQKITLPDEEFGEGIAVLGDKIYMLTWRNRKGYVFDRNTFEQLATFRYPGEGWGLTTDGEELILSNGGPKLHYYDPETLGPVMEKNDAGRMVEKVVRVRAEKVRTFEGINELEFINNRVYANILGKDSILQIDPMSGLVLAFLDLKGLQAPGERSERNAVLNGIAFDRAANKLYVTGKLWPKLYEIREVANED